MNIEIRYYHCPACHHAPHVRVTEEMHNEKFIFECEYCLQEIEVDSDTPQVEAETHPIQRQ